MYSNLPCQPFQKLKLQLLILNRPIFHHHKNRNITALQGKVKKIKEFKELTCNIQRLTFSLIRVNEAINMNIGVRFWKSEN